MDKNDDPLAGNIAGRIPYYALYYGVVGAILFGLGIFLIWLARTLL